VGVLGFVLWGGVFGVGGWAQPPNPPIPNPQSPIPIIILLIKNLNKKNLKNE